MNTPLEAGFQTSAEWDLVLLHLWNH